MSPAAPNSLSTDTARFPAEKRRVALRSMAAAAAMTPLKIAAGLLSGSVGVLADATHSALDLVAATLTFFSVRVSEKPADGGHTYGHGKFENLSAFLETGLMAVSCTWIIWEAMVRILSHTVVLHHSILPILVLLPSIGVDSWRSRNLPAVANRTCRAALATDAFHFASDIWSTVAVLAGLGASWIGLRLGVTWLRYADPIAAVVVSLMILRMSLHLGRETVAVLTDEVPSETRPRLVAEVAKVQGVLSVEQSRVRRSGANYFADLNLRLPRRSTFEHTGELVRAATEADVVVHTIPRVPRAESIFDRVRTVAARNSVHELSVQSHQGRLRVEQPAERDENMPLLAAHGFLSGLEAEILREATEIDSVLTPIESEPATIEQPEVIVEVDRKIERALRATPSVFEEIVEVHEIPVGRTVDHISLCCHCTLPDQLPIDRVHEVITALEGRFKLEYPEVYRVTIHPEPMTVNLR